MLGALLDGPLGEAELLCDFERFADPLGLNALTVYQNYGFILSVCYCGYWLVAQNTRYHRCVFRDFSFFSCVPLVFIL